MIKMKKIVDFQSTKYYIEIVDFKSTKNHGRGFEHDQY